MSKRPINLETKLPRGLQPSLENNELLINKFLKSCSKESLVQYLYDNSSYTKRFTKSSILERQRQLKYKRNAQIANLQAHTEEKVNKKKKKVVQKQTHTKQ
jgi:hypothetical protein